MIKKSSVSVKKKSLNILVVTLAVPLLEGYKVIPRGTYAIIHFLEQFGHVVQHINRKDLINPWQLLRKIRQYNPDIILTQHLVAAEVAVLRKIGYIKCPVMHAWDDYYAEQSRFPFWLTWPLEIIGVRWSDYITSVSKYNIHLAEKWGVPCSFIPHGTHGEEKETDMLLNSHKIKVIYLGDQDIYKGTGKLVEVVRELNCDLFMVGKINEQLKDIAPENVKFVGTVPADEVQSVLAQADILINPSNQDSNFKFFEYIKAGKPILGTKGKAEWAFNNGEEALLVDDLKAGLQRLINDSDLRTKLAENISKRETLSWEEAVCQLERVMYSLL